MKKYLFVVILGLVSLFHWTAPAQAQPCQWNYSIQPGTPDPNQGVATATYCGNVNVAGTITGSTVNDVLNIAALKAITAPSSLLYVNVAGYYSSGDGGGGAFSWVAGSCTPNDVTLFASDTVSTSVGCWKRNVNSVLVWQDGGAKFDGVTNDSAAIQAVMDAAPNNAYISSAWPSGATVLNSGITVPATKTLSLDFANATVTCADNITCLTISYNDNSGASDPKAAVSNAFFVCSVLGNGTGILIQDSSKTNLHHIYAKNCASNYTLKNVNAFTEQTIFNDVHSINGDCGISIDATNSPSGSFAATSFDGFIIDTMNGASSATPNGFCIESSGTKQPSIYRSTFSNVIIFPDKDGATAFRCDCDMTDAWGQINIEDPSGHSAVTGFNFLAGTVSTSLDIYSDVRSGGTIANPVSYGAGVQISGLTLGNKTNGNTLIVNSSGSSTVASASSYSGSTETNYYADYVTGGTYQRRWSYTNPAQVKDITDGTTFAPFNMVSVGTGTGSDISSLIAGNNTVSAKGRNIFYLVGNAAGSVINQISQGADGQNLLIYFGDTNTSVAYNSGAGANSIYTSGSASIVPSSAGCRASFQYVASGWRQTSAMICP